MTNYREILDRALASPRGLRVTFETRALATRFRDRCNKLRVADRKTNARAQSKPLAEGQSQFDGLILRLDGGTLLIEHEGSMQPMEVEEIGI